MNAIFQSNLDRLAYDMPKDIDHLIVSASYEDRAIGVWAALKEKIPGCIFVCYNANHKAYLDVSLDRFTSQNVKQFEVPLDSDLPNITFTALLEIFEHIGGGVCHLGVDVTGFTREVVAMLMFLAKERLSRESKLTVFYHRASKYGKDLSKGWLSQGVREIRSILGYSGQIRPTANTHLMMISGFEIERAQEIIDAVEPSHLSLGKLISSNHLEDVPNPHDDLLEIFTTRVRSYYSGSPFSEIGFSAIDPFETKARLLEGLPSRPTNVIVSCLNSKVAMVGVCLAALEQPRIQLIYAQPIYYNLESYSESSGKVILFTLAQREFMGSRI